MIRPIAIFDVDGTLVDSRALITSCMQEAFRAHGLDEPSYDKVRSIVGLSLQTAIDRIAPRDLDHDGLLVLVDRYKNAFVKRRKAGQLHEPLYAGAIELLETLKQEGWLIGVATGKSRRGLDAIIKTHGFAAYLDCHFCADDTVGKPHPAMVEANLTALCALPQQAVMIGDTSFDMLMGKSAGVHALGVSWGFHTKEEIAAAGADKILETMDDLASALDDFSQNLKLE